jgi:phosphatidylglycerol lysyltransferase
VFEWFFIFLVIWGLCYILKIPVTLYELFPVFIIASCTGIISMIPGGLGTFDLVFLWGLQDLVDTDEKVIILLLLYRLGYFIIPFFIGLFLLLKLYWGKWNKSWSNIPSILVQNVSHMMLTGLVLLSGIILLLSAAVPGILERLKNIEEIFSLPIINLSHQLSVATGFVLLALSRGIEYKSKRTYFLTLSVLIFAAIFTFIKGFDYEEAIFIIVVAVLLRMSKKRFYRENFVLTWGKILFDLFIILLFTTLYIVIGIINLPMTKINLPPSLIPTVIVDSNDLFISAIVGLSIAVFIMGVGYIVKGSRRFPLIYSETQSALIKNQIETFKGNTLTHLFFLGDKYFYWNKEKDVLFAYQIVADKLVILGDPVGNSANIPHSIEELIETADIFGYTPVFYQVNSSMLPLLHGNGFDFFKLGEEAFVNLTTFSLAGKKGKNLRVIKNRYEKEAFSFQIIDPPFSEEILRDLQNVSDEWLCNRKEKGFSLGFFDKDYLEKAPIAVLYDKEGNMIGFASLMPNYDGHETISVDLMRFIPNSPNGLMDYIFVSLFEWAKEAGYSRFNMGMAPLSNVGSSRFSFLSEKIAAQIFLHGHFIYHFQGLRRFKEKYADYWEPKYLAYRKNAGLPITMLQVTKLIAKKKQGNKVL